MQKKTLTSIFIFVFSQVYSQVVIGSDRVSEAAILKLDMENRAFKIPIISIPSKFDVLTPVQNPARGLLIYNSNPLISDNLSHEASYWAENQYNSLSTKQGIEDVINNSEIPLLIFSTTVGQKNIIPCGSGACSNWTWTPFNPTESEILIDSYAGWNIGNNTYSIPETNNYIIEYHTNISNVTNGGGTSSQTISQNTNTINNTLGRYVTLTNRAYTIVMFVQEFIKGDILDFKYIYTQNNYRLETGTINIYKY